MDSKPDRDSQPFFELRSRKKISEDAESGVNPRQSDCHAIQGQRQSLAWNSLLEPFVDLEPLHERLAFVLNQLPPAVQADFLNDPHFRISLDDCEPGKGRTVWMPCLNPNGSESRCVVLKPRLALCDESFSLYIIAHELAHAFLRNGGWGEIADREDAADALAANWGFPRPTRTFSWRGIV